MNRLFIVIQIIATCDLLSACTIEGEARGSHGTSTGETVQISDGGSKPIAQDHSGGAALPGGSKMFSVNNPTHCVTTPGGCSPCYIKFELAKVDINGGVISSPNDKTIQQGDRVKVYVSSSGTGEGSDHLGVTLNSESVPGGDDWFVNRGGFDALSYPNQQHFLQDNGMYGEPIWKDGDPRHEPVGTLIQCGAFTWKRGYGYNGQRCLVERTYFVPCK